MYTMMAKPMRTFEYNSAVNHVRCGCEFLLDFIEFNACFAHCHQGPAIIQWSYRYSCWKLFALELDTFLESVGSGAGKKCSCTCTVGYLLLGSTNALQITVVSDSAVMYMYM